MSRGVVIRIVEGKLRAEALLKPAKDVVAFMQIFIILSDQVAEFGRHDCIVNFSTLRIFLP